MALTKTQLSFITKIRASGASELGVKLDDAICSYIIAVIVKDLGLEENFTDLPQEIPSFFTNGQLSELRIEGINFLSAFERLVSLREDADTYFYCLASLHKARLKYERILKAQAIPTIEQVGPRGLLQYGSLSPEALAAFLFWRKWIYDIDNRAGQETGYAFEPIIAHALGGVPFSAKKSPVTRGGAGKQGRQVDCLLEIKKKAYEIKLRVTIAASGQGRWREELVFPSDCRASGYTPVLVVLDPTKNNKLEELSSAFVTAGGEVYVGSAAWTHLEATAGHTMAHFIANYVHTTINSLLNEAPEELPDITFKIDSTHLTVTVCGEVLRVKRDNQTITSDDEEENLPEDVDEHLPSP
jgi:hypothetical protein